MEKDKKTKIEEIFNRGTVVEILPSKELFIERLLSKNKTKIYIGVDPNSNSLHLGHAKNIMFLEELRQLGCEVILLMGDFTAQIGDPDKKTTRPQLTAKETKNYATKWMKQVSSILNFTDKKNPAKILYNSKWLSKLSLIDVVNLSKNFTVQQFIERDLFEKRIKEGSPIHLHEFLYPLMQGYDSVAMDVDAELCGTDQKFNALAGRTLQKRIKNKEKFVITLNLIANPQTKELMSKSNKTGVFIDASAQDLFGSIMALPDSMMDSLFLNCTRIPLEEREKVFSKGPRQAKEIISYEIVKIFHGEKKAKDAKENFNTVFSGGGVPKNTPTYKLKRGELIIESLFNAQIGSKAELKRLISSGSIKNLDINEIIKEWNQETKRGTYKIGKHRFIKII